MKIFLALMLLCFSASAAEVTVKVPIPKGATSFDMIFTVPDISVTPPESTEPPEVNPPDIPVTDTRLYWPDERPDWCFDDVHFCISTEDNNGEEVNNAYKVSKDYTKPQPLSDTDTPNAPIGNECKHRYFTEGTRGVVVESEPHYESPYAITILCQPLPSDGAKAWKFQFGPGTHEQTINVHARYPTIYVGDNENRPFIDCAKGPTAGDHASAGKACIGGKQNTDMTIVGLNGRVGYQVDGVWHSPSDSGFRCVMPGTGKLTMTDSNFVNCRQGVQGGALVPIGKPGRVWEFTRVRMENCSFRGEGTQHCIYSGSPAYEGDTPHAQIIVRDSYLQTCGGHPIKSNSDKALVEDSELVEGEGKCDTGAAVDNNSCGEVTLRRVKITQPEASGNDRIFFGGAADNVSRCRFPTNGAWHLEDVTIIDHIPNPNKNSRVKDSSEDKPPSTWNYSGTNLYTDSNGETVPLEQSGVFP